MPQGQPEQSYEGYLFFIIVIGLFFFCLQALNGVNQKLDKKYRKLKKEENKQEKDFDSSES
jgi:Sec-independent protein translocase protein TatA